MKKKISLKKLFYLLISVVIIVLITITGFRVYNDFVKKEKDPVNATVELDSLSLYGYVLSDTDTNVYKEYYEELKKVLNSSEVDYSLYSELLTKLFVVDFYTLSNKIASTDIGGLEFIHLNQIDNFKINAGDTIYNTIQNNIDGTRTQELPEVKSVVVSKVTKATYTYNNAKYEAYEVECSWEYVTDMGYDKSATFVLIKDNNKLNVVEEKLVG